MMKKKVIMMKKEDRPLDETNKALLKSLQKSRIMMRNRKFKEWLNQKNPDDLPNKCFVRYFTEEIKTLLKYYRYEITDEKKFKDEIATFIYKLSEPNAFY